MTGYRVREPKPTVLKDQPSAATDNQYELVMRYRANEAGCRRLLIAIARYHVAKGRHAWLEVVQSLTRPVEIVPADPDAPPSHLLRHPAIQQGRRP